MTIFIIIGFVGVALLLASLVLGDFFDFLNFDVLESDFFSTAAIAGFLGAFGFGGAIADSLTGNLTLSLIIGAVAGVVFAWLALRLTRYFRNDHAVVTRADAMIGTDAVVITAIPAGGYGEIRVRLAGQWQKVSAKSAVPMDAGSQVWVSGILSPTAVEVTPTNPELTP